MRKQYIQDETSCLENPTILFEKEKHIINGLFLYNDIENII